MAEIRDSDDRNGKGWAMRLDKRRAKGPSANEESRGPNTGAWEKLYSGWRGREKYSREWNSQYDGPGKGTW